MKKRICFLLVALLLLTGCARDEYEQAQTLYQSGAYAAAAQAFAVLGDYKDSAQMVTVCEYALAQQLFEDENWVGAEAAFAALGDYQDSAQKLTHCRYEQAKILLEGDAYPEAEQMFTALGDYQDSAGLVLRCRKEWATALLEAGDYLGAMEIFRSLEGFENAEEGLRQARWLQLQRFLIEQPPYMTEEGYSVGMTAIGPDQLTFWVEKTVDLGFYAVVDRCAVSFTLGAAEGRYELQSQSQTQADGLTGRTSSSAGGTVALAELTADTQLPLTDFHYHSQDVYGNVTERTEPWLGERERFDEIRDMLPMMLEQVAALLERSGTGYTLQELGFTGV